MPKKEKEEKEDKDTGEQNWQGCYGEKVKPSELVSFLGDIFAANTEAEKLRSDERFATCIWGHSGSGKCVSGDTLISTSIGDITIGSLFDGDLKEGWYNAPKGLRIGTCEGYGSVEKLYYSGVKPSLSIRTDFGRTLTGGLNHRVLVVSSHLCEGICWKTMPKLSLGDFVVVSSSSVESKDVKLPDISSIPAYWNVFRDFKVPTAMTPDLAYVLGCLVAEGDGTSDGIRFCQSVGKKMAVEFVSRFKKCFGFELKFEHDKRTKDTGSFYCHRKLLRRWMEAIGLSYSYSKDKEIPWSVMVSSSESQMAFLSALYEGEGGNEEGRICLSSASKKLIEQTSFLLLKFGVQSSVSSRVVDGKNYYGLNAGGDNGRKLAQMLSFSRASGKWLNAKSNPNNGCIPTAWAYQFLREMKDSHLLNGGKLTKKMIHSHPLMRIYNMKHITATCSKDSFCRIASLLDKADEHFKKTVSFVSGKFFERIVSIENGGEIPLYDVSVKGVHKFNANGIVSHNTAIVKQHCEKPITWRGKEYPGYKVYDVPIAQFEEMGDLHGMPARHVLMSKQNGKGPVERWIPEEVVQGYLTDGWQMEHRAGVKTMYAPPDWVPSEPGPSILLLDDWNRASVRIIKGIMQLLQNYGMVSWKLPEGCNIILTGNPDEQDYLVTSIDAAILTRIRSITLKVDAKEWAVWAQSASLDPRLINFCLTYPEMMIGAERTNPRTLSELGRCLRKIPNLTSKEDQIRFKMMASSLLDDQTVSTLMVFIERDVEMIIEPEQVLAGEDWIKDHIHKLMSQAEKRIDVLGVICDRLFAYLVQPTTTADKKSIKNFQDFLCLEEIPEDLRHNLCLRIARVRDRGNVQQWIMYNDRLKKLIMEIV